MVKRRQRIAASAAKLAKLGVFVKGDEVRGEVYKYGPYPVWRVNMNRTYPFGHYIRNDGIGDITKTRSLVDVFNKSERLYGSRETLQEALELAIRQDEVVSRLTAYLQKKGLYE
jgi:hypothetical protein